MKVKLLRDILVGPSDAMPTPKGNVVDLPDDQAREYFKLGHAEEVTAKKTAKESAKAEPKVAAQRGRKAKK